MIRKLLIVSAATLAATGAAFAADLPSRVLAPVPPPPPPVFSWTGFYIGANAGYAFDSNHSFNTSANDPVTAGFIAAGIVPVTGNLRSDGFTGGGQIGYNYEFGNGSFPVLGSLSGTGGVVIGVEADAAYTDLRQSGAVFLGGVNTAVQTRTEFVGTVRGRIGYGFDRVLVYGTGGFAYGSANDFSVGTLAGTGIYTGGRDNIRTGYAYGGGVEYALATDSFLNFFHSSAVTVKAEFIHYDLGTTNYAIIGNPAIGLGGTSFNDRVHVDGNIVRVGVNYKFGEPAPVPVVARY